MIFDSAKHLDFYKGLGLAGRYEKAVEFLKNQDLAALEPGKHVIDGDDVYANVFEYTTVPWEEARFEAHHVYTDIQYIVKGSEVMTYAPAEDLHVSEEYNAEKDIMFFDNSNPGYRVTVHAGEFVIFHPWDGHKPKAADGAPSPAKKIVIKIKEN